MGESVGTQKNAIEQIYDQLMKVFGGTNKDQVFTMLMPGTSINPVPHSYDTTKEKPLSTEEADSRLADQLFDVAKVSGSSNGQRLSIQYMQALSVLVADFHPALPKLKANLRQFLETPAPQNALLNGVPFSGSLRDYYFALHREWIKAKAAWVERDIKMREDKTKTQEDYLEWYTENADVALAEVEGALARVVSVLAPSEMDAILGALEAGPGGAIEEAMEMVQSVQKRSPRGGYFYPVEFSPNDWFLDLRSDIPPVDLLKAPEFIAESLSAKRRALSAGIGQLRSLLQRMPGESEVKSAAADLAKAEEEYSKAHQDIVGTYTDNTALAVEIYLATNQGKSTNAESGLKESATKAKSGRTFNADDVKQIVAGQERLIKAQDALTRTSTRLASAGRAVVATEASRLPELPAMLERVQSQLTELDEAQRQLALSAENYESSKARPGFAAVGKSDNEKAQKELGAFELAFSDYSKFEDAKNVLTIDLLRTAAKKANEAMTSNGEELGRVLLAEANTCADQALRSKYENLKARILLPGDGLSCKLFDEAIAKENVSLYSVPVKLGVMAQQLMRLRVSDFSERDRAIREAQRKVTTDLETLKIARIKEIAGATTVNAGTPEPTTAQQWIDAVTKVDTTKSAVIAEALRDFEQKLATACLDKYPEYSKMLKENEYQTLEDRRDAIAAYAALKGSAPLSKATVKLLGLTRAESVEEAVRKFCTDEVAVQGPLNNLRHSYILNAVKEAATPREHSAQQSGTSSRFMDLQFSFSSTEVMSSSSADSSFSQKSWGVHAFFGSAGGSSATGSGSSQESAFDSNTEIKIGLRAAKVEVQRPWFDPGIFGLTDCMSRLSARVISYGPKDWAHAEETKNSLLPAFPVAFIVAKDVTITFKASQSSLSSMKSILDSRSATGGGFLCFSASSSSATHHDESALHTRMDGDVVTITMPAPQILGWFLEFTPEDHSHLFEANNLAASRPGWLNMIAYVQKMTDTLEPATGGVGAVSKK